jgi:hypothetical protein
MIFTSTFIFAVDDLRFVRMQRQSAISISRLKSSPQRHSLVFCAAVANRIVGIALERYVRAVPAHPHIERIMKNEIRQLRRQPFFSMTYLNWLGTIASHGGPVSAPEGNSVGVWHFLAPGQPVETEIRPIPKMIRRELALSFLTAKECVVCAMRMGSHFRPRAVIARAQNCTPRRIRCPRKHCASRRE